MNERWTASSYLLSLLSALALAAALLSSLLTDIAEGSIQASELNAPKPAVTDDKGQSLSAADASSTQGPSLLATTVPTATGTPKSTATAAVASTASATATSTATGTVVGTATATATGSATPTSTATATLTSTATSTPTPHTGATATATPTATVPSEATATGTATGVATGTPSPTATSIPAGTGAPTATATATATGTPTATPMATGTPKPGSLANDDIYSAPEIRAFPYTTSLDTSGATLAPGDPDLGLGTGPGGATVWFRLVPPGGGSLTASTEGSSYDTVLAVYTGTPPNLTREAFNDDISFDAGVVQSRVAFDVKSGTTYFLEVAGYADSEEYRGNLQLSVVYSTSAAPTVTPEPTRTAWPTATPTSTTTTWTWYDPLLRLTATPGPAPANDDFGSATLVGPLPYVDDLDTTGATVASDDPNMGSDTGRNSNTVWYRFVPSTAGIVRVGTLGSDYDTVLAVFTGSRGALTLLASNDDLSPSVQSEVRFETQPGVAYYLEVAQYGTVSGGGHLRLMVESTRSLAAGTLTPTVSATSGVLGAAPDPIPPAARVSQPVVRDSRYFAQTGYRVNLEPFWDYFQKRGGVNTFGYPISWEFRLFGFKVQMFQRGILQLMPNGGVASMNLLDEGLMPYNRINFSTFPSPEKELIETAPSPLDPDYGQKAIEFLNAHVPDRWEGMEVNFLSSFLSTVRYEDAFPRGDGQPELIPLLNLELWGLPTSRPAFDPTNRDFVYQRFQRGILMYDKALNATQGLLLADYLKSIMTGQDLPADLEEQVRTSRFYRQYTPGRPGYLARPALLSGSNLEGAFEPDLARPAAVPTPTPVAAPTAPATKIATR